MKESVIIYYDDICNETDLAYCIDTGDDSIWIPKEYVLSIDDIAGEIEIPEWIALDKGLI